MMDLCVCVLYACGYLLANANGPEKPTALLLLLLKCDCHRRRRCCYHHRWNDDASVSVLGYYIKAAECRVRRLLCNVYTNHATQSTRKKNPRLFVWWWRTQSFMGFRLSAKDWHFSILINHCQSWTWIITFVRSLVGWCGNVHQSFCKYYTNFCLLFCHMLLESYKQILNAVPKNKSITFELRVYSRYAWPWYNDFGLVCVPEGNIKTNRWRSWREWVL